MDNIFSHKVNNKKSASKDKYIYKNDANIKTANFNDANNIANNSDNKNIILNNNNSNNNLNNLSNEVYNPEYDFISSDDLIKYNFTTMDIFFDIETVSNNNFQFIHYLVNRKQS